MKSKSLIILMGMLLSSCSNKENKLEIIRDTRYFEPPYRFEGMENGDSIIYLSERYFVLNYRDHKDVFEQAALEVLCNKLNDSVKVSIYFVDFQDVGIFGPTKYKEGMPLSAELSSPIVTMLWNKSLPDSIQFEYDTNDGSLNQRLRSFDCRIWYLNR